MDLLLNNFAYVLNDIYKFIKKSLLYRLYNIKYKSNVYFRNEKDKKELFCSVCFDSDCNLIHLHTTADNDVFICDKCGHIVSLNSDNLK